MKFRFGLTNDRNRSGFRNENPLATYCAFDTTEIVSWTLYTVEHNLNALEVWFKGGADSMLLIKEENVGSPNFQRILNFLGSEFPDIEQVKLPEPTIAFEEITLESDAL